MKISIIGGNGKMGALFARFFAGQGHDVESLGRKDEPIYKQRLEHSDVVIITVPIALTIDVIRKAGPFVPEKSLFMDMTSIKTGPLRAMLESFSGEVVGTHPLFGPSASVLCDQTIVVTPGRGEKWLAWLIDIFKNNSVRLTLSTPDEHDRMMAFTQGIRTLNTMVLSRLIMKYNIDPARIMEFATPIFKGEMWWIGRLFAQDPDLYAGIHMENEAIKAVLEDYLEAGEEITDAVIRKDMAVYSEFFKDASCYFQDITDEAKTKSDQVINEIVRRPRPPIN